ncbi:unnamed protein product [Alternaria alternata]
MLPPEQKLYWSVQYDVVPGDEVPQSCATALIRAETWFLTLVDVDLKKVPSLLSPAAAAVAALDASFWQFDNAVLRLVRRSPVQPESTIVRFASDSRAAAALVPSTEMLSLLESYLKAPTSSVEFSLAYRNTPLANTSKLPPLLRSRNAPVSTANSLLPPDSSMRKSSADRALGQRIVQKGSGAEKVQSGVTGVGNDYLNHRILQSGQLNTERVFCLKQIDGSGNSA